MLRFALLCCAVLLASCSYFSPPPPPQPDKLVLQPLNFHALTGWDADNHSEALQAFMKSCDAFMREPDTAASGEGPLLAPVSVWKFICRRGSLVPPGDSTLARQFFEEQFVPMRAFNNDKPGGLFTGYYVPMLTGSHVQQRPFVYPVYGLGSGPVPTYTRSQIDRGALRGQAPVLAFVDDPVRLFFMQIQGSGYIRMEDGEVLKLGYAGTNGLPYVSIGKVLADQGVMDRKTITMARLRQWLYDHPGQMWQVMWENPSYIFFRVLPGDVVGTQEVPLTPERSIAVDTHFIPLGMPVFIDTLMPSTTLGAATIYRRLTVAQDSGSGIHGPIRADLFFGSGLTAETLAGNMKEGGSYTLLVPRALAGAAVSR